MFGLGLGLGLGPAPVAASAPPGPWVTNGGFAADTDWTKSAASVTISGGKAHIASAAGTRRLYQPASAGNTFTVGHTYRFTGTLSNDTGGVGALIVRAGADSSGLNGTASSALIVDDIIFGGGAFDIDDLVATTVTGNYLVFSFTSGAAVDLDNVTVQDLG